MNEQGQSENLEEIREHRVLLTVLSSPQAHIGTSALSVHTTALQRCWAYLEHLGKDAAGSPNAMPTKKENGLPGKILCNLPIFLGLWAPLKHCISIQTWFLSHQNTWVGRKPNCSPNTADILSPYLFQFVFIVPSTSFQLMEEVLGWVGGPHFQGSWGVSYAAPVERVQAVQSSTELMSLHYLIPGAALSSRLRHSYSEDHPITPETVPSPERIPCRICPHETLVPNLQAWVVCHISSVQLLRRPGNTYQYIKQHHRVL